MEFLTKYLFSDWDQLPFLLIAILLNVISGIILSSEFSWKILLQKLKDKFLFYGIGLLAIHAISFLPIDGVPLANADLHVALVNIDINAFRTLNFIAIIYMSTFELLSTDENIFQKYNRRFIPYMIGDPLRKFLKGPESIS